MRWAVTRELRSCSPVSRVRAQLAARRADDLSPVSEAGLPDGLDTVLGPGGTMLSAGEEQLLAFARLLVRDVRVVVLDEATARMDPLTEARVVIEDFRIKYNQHRPHSKLGYQTPAHFAANLPPSLAPVLKVQDLDRRHQVVGQGTDGYRAGGAPRFRIGEKLE